MRRGEAVSHGCLVDFLRLARHYHPMKYLLIAMLGVSSASESNHRFYEVHGAKLYTQTFGRGAPVLFLHGGMLFFDNAFPKQRDYFAATHTVIGIDQRGHGHSPGGAWKLSYLGMAEDTAAIIERLGLGPVDIVGHSDGANIGLLLARDHPQLVRRLVISGANLRSGLSAAEFEERGKWSAEQTAAKVRELAARLPPWFKQDYASVSPDGADHYLSMLTKCYELWGQPIVMEPAALKKIAAPVLVMAGDHDFTSIEETTEIFRGLPRGRLLILPKTGHGTFGERPELVNLAIRDFLDEPG
jgi:pimeloyl-ACP methyl ester carboxylesterase